VAIIEVKNVTKRFRTHRGASMLLGRGGPMAWLLGQRRRYFNALDDVTFEIEAGESVGIIGANGSGKSTLLKLIGGVSVPTTGEITVRGRVASLLELGAGFHPALSGRENVYLNGTILGMSRAQIDAVYPHIVAFAELAEFIDNPVDTYSSGMYVRLGFSVAVHSNPDIFLVDEVLAVGDESFQRKCRVRIGELKDQGKTIVFVSHDLNVVNTLCDRVVLLSKGSLIVRKTPRETIDYYLRLVGQDKGVHTMRQGPIELLAANGRLSLFHNERSLTPTTGIELVLMSMGADHNAQFADWSIAESGPGHCRAIGRMVRLPVEFIWDVRLEDSVITWRISMRCERSLHVTEIAINMFVIPEYSRWLYADLTGDFPAILPSDTTSTHVVTHETGVRSTAVFPDNGEGESSLPAILVRLKESAYHTQLMWANTDYMTGSRILRANMRIPSTEQPLEPGEYDLMTLEFDLGQSESAIREDVLQMHTVTAGPLAARFQQGRLEIRHKGELVTTDMHLWSSVFRGNLWNNSDSLRWEGVQRDGDTLLFVGESRRAPFFESWRLWRDGDAIAIQISIRAKEPMSIQEFHFSLMVPANYRDWELPGGKGTFPDFIQGEEDWIHLNDDYSEGGEGALLSESMPRIRLSLDHCPEPFCMTVLNTGSSLNSRVLQALWVSSHGAHTFDTNERIIFDGRIIVAPA